MDSMMRSFFSFQEWRERLSSSTLPILALPLPKFLFGESVEVLRIHENRKVAYVFVWKVGTALKLEWFMFV